MSQHHKIYEQLWQIMRNVMLWKKVLKQQIKVGQKVKDGKSKEKAQLG